RARRARAASAAPSGARTAPGCPSRRTIPSGCRAGGGSRRRAADAPAWARRSTSVVRRRTTRPVVRVYPPWRAEPARPEEVMEPMTRTFLIAAACAVSLAAASTSVASAEDLTLVFKSTNKDGASTATSYYSSEKMRTGDAEHETVLEYAAGKITSIDHKKKEYSEITLAEMDAAMKEAQAQMDQMAEQMKNMPPAVREKMEAMMGGAAGSVTV